MSKTKVITGIKIGSNKQETYVCRVLDSSGNEIISVADFCEKFKAVFAAGVLWERKRVAAKIRETKGKNVKPTSQENMETKQ